jgi:hypothetical protein
VEQPIITVANAYYLITMIQRGQNGRANHSVQSGRVTAAGIDSDTFDCSQFEAPSDVSRFACSLTQS